MVPFIWLLLTATNQSLGASDAETDPFTEVSPKASSPNDETGRTGWKSFFSENFGFRKEWMSEFGLTNHGYAASRQSAGFEVQKKFSTATKTFASVDFQGRFVRRDGFVGFPNDMEGMNRAGWYFEYHNVYVDLYNFLDPLLGEKHLSGNVGRFNARLGRFYVPFGLNLQTDTHGSILQLSNERNFGFERDWYAGFWGNLSEEFHYDLYYLVGSGYPLRFNGQQGLLAGRLSLANKYSSDDGWEGGVSFLGGKRVARDATERSPAVLANAGASNQVSTLRIGVDARYRRPVSTGLLTWTSELSGGRDVPDVVLTQLHQLDYLHASRRWGISTQFRWFWQDMTIDRQLFPSNAPDTTDSSLLTEVTWYFANDVGGSNLHWIKFNCEAPLKRQRGTKNAVWTLQYYRYW